ncbi:uncharacterized protein LOC110097806 [Dendrobium catenatum]|uniref:Phospholipase A1-IIbeta n=1 Tax=Dendrobium catenatum TaxID=906689 RepID=A0A2I0WGK7_9ASPA|nr:uncharacterized protein LOC110097806 [Dendrobium catenatum]PKU74783.1 Phospholipase A1-IIbeta [Dendrobium catenatum]
MAAYEKPSPAKREYLIVRPEKIGWFHLLSLLIFRRNLTSYKFLETDSVEEGIPTDIITVITLFIQKLLASISGPMKVTGLIVEFLLNFISLNGGILGLIKRIITVSVVIPKREDANFRTLIGQIDGRTNLYKSNALIQYYPFMEAFSDLSDLNLLDLTMMSSKIAYENAAFIKNVVNNVWKMHFVGFYNCWNKFLNDHTTQAFIFCNKETDADLIVLAFRGTEPFNANDWSTDVDLSWLLANKLGNIHLGFLKALGLQNEKSFLLGFPTNFNSTTDKPIAYYTIREQLASLLKVHKNAKIVVTGHSLGGALAALFPALLSYHNQSNILSSLYGTFTYGQPRVGDQIFVAYVKAIIKAKSYRMVYRYDVVPRIPFDAPPVALFKHFGTCVYYKSWYKAEIMDDAPNPNYFDPLFVVSMYLSAWGDLLKALFIRWTQGKEYKEGTISILYRCLGLIIPGIASHSPRDYVNGGRLAKMAQKFMV